MALACSPIPTAETPPHSRKSKGELARFSKGGFSLTNKYKPNAGSHQSFESPTTGSRDLTHSPAVCPYILRYPLLSCLWQCPFSKGGEQAPTASTTSCSSGSPSTGAYSPPHQIPCTSPPCSLCFKEAVSLVHPILHLYGQILLLSFHTNGVCWPLHHALHDASGNNQLCRYLLYPSHEDNPLALLVLNPTTGDMLEHCQLQRNPWYKTTWDTLYANKLGRLCQGIGSREASSSKLVAGTNTFFCIDYHDIPLHKRKKICHTMVVCEVHPEKDNPNCTRITIGGNCICYPGDVCGYKHSIVGAS
jgi:hypothetical protein